MNDELFCYCDKRVQDENRVAAVIQMLYVRLEMAGVVDDGRRNICTAGRKSNQI